MKLKAQWHQLKIIIIILISNNSPTSYEHDYQYISLPFLHSQTLKFFYTSRPFVFTIDSKLY